MRKPSPAMIVALLSLFLALGGAGIAATGGSFILGKSNTADATSYLSAPVAGESALNLSNTNTATGSSALKLNVASGHPPMLVNSSTKVPSLNADTLDGIDSSGFVQGRGTFLAKRMTLAATDPPNVATLFTIPGLGSVVADCEPSSSALFWTNDTQSNILVWTDFFNNPHFIPVGEAPGDQVTIGQRSAGVWGGTLALGIGSRQALVHGFMYQNADGKPCTFQAQATYPTGGGF